MRLAIDPRLQREAGSPARTPLCSRLPLRPDFVHGALDLYRRYFTPSKALEKPYVMVGINVVAVNTQVEARRLFTSLQQKQTSAAVWPLRSIGRHKTRDHTSSGTVASLVPIRTALSKKMTEPNPYAAPTSEPAFAAPEGIDPASVRKIEAIIKDAGQFWLAILLCMVCTGFGAIIIGPWYFVRFLQWNSLARDQPALLTPGAPRGSLVQRFQSAKTKLVAGMGFGAFVLLLLVGVLAISAL